MAFFGSKIRSHYAADQMNHIPQRGVSIPCICSQAEQILENFTLYRGKTKQVQQGTGKHLTLCFSAAGCHVSPRAEQKLKTGLEQTIKERNPYERKSRNAQV